jgi:hypothetical protein
MKSANLRNLQTPHSLPAHWCFALFPVRIR